MSDAPASSRRLAAASLAILALVGLLSAASLGAAPAAQSASRLDRFKPVAAQAMPASPMIRTRGSFSGYTNYWHDIAWVWHQYGNLFQMSVPDPAAAAAQAKRDTAEELGLPGLDMEEGFLAEFLAGPVERLDHPDLAALESALAGSDRPLIVAAPFSSEAGRRLAAMAPPISPAAGHQARAMAYAPVRAFILRDGTRKLFVVLAEKPEARSRLASLLDEAASVVARFDLHRGWFGTGTLLHSVTCFPGHPLEVMAKGMNQGNDWFTFNGYMDYLLQPQLPAWLEKVGLDVVTDVGTGKATHSLGTIAYGLRDWDGLKIQDMPTEEAWIAFVKDKGGFLFRPVFAPECDRYAYDGVIAIEGNKRQADEENDPFILQTGMIREDAPACMVLFTPKGTAFNREAMWKAILERRAAGVLPMGKMLGPRLFRNALQLLWLDRIFLERRFGDAVQLAAEVKGRTLVVKSANAGGERIAGVLTVRLPPELSLTGAARRELTLAPSRDSVESFPLSAEQGGHGPDQPHSRGIRLAGGPEAHPGRPRPAARNLGAGACSTDRRPPLIFRFPSTISARRPRSPSGSR